MTGAPSPADRGGPATGDLLADDVTEVRTGHAPTDDRDDATLGQLMSEAFRDLGELVRKELELARTELREEVGNATAVGKSLGGLALTGYLAMVLLSFAAAWGLDEVMPAGLAFLVVGLVFAVAAAVLYRTMRERLRRLDPVPRRTVETIKEDVEWARHPTS